MIKIHIKNEFIYMIDDDELNKKKKFDKPTEKKESRSGQHRRSSSRNR